MKKILFLSGTRADFGKLKSLICQLEDSVDFETYLFVTGMHMLSRYGLTVSEVESEGFKNIHKFINQNGKDTMDIVLSKTIQGLSDYVKEYQPDMIIVHGDRVEALSGAIVGSLNNILVGHIEGGEVSGTIDELIRHSVTKMSHLHFVSNDQAKKRLLQLGEIESSVFVIGSPDFDIMNSKKLPSVNEVKARYDIDFNDYAVLMYHPVTTEISQLETNIKEVITAVENSRKNFVVIYPNNDHGSEIIIKELERLENNERFRVFPSLRFEYFLVLLKNANFIIGNSSAGVREMPFYGKQTINLGSRQNNRSKAKSICNIQEKSNLIEAAINNLHDKSYPSISEYGHGQSSDLLIKALSKKEIWKTRKQKIFMDINN
jgi:UDP-N-acetylglucosamine 2-epimerase (hydrolysing)